ncbi:PQQ-binding-like beta-propeller repeat protein [Polymorphobacter fuscus]|uniref:PQQ-binding-like beta-propeller repeat protein n=2 Tax=Sandarakinorhabdus fusca TaxID=1439888 RepID=A0A7C9KV78_9SPHN|nr:PQQ-binding-like beta-propeller repeat protein [Polymorphobacter fuscus]MQT15722.1 PQQ-binding-like beta-propeller repeat protein [Polymorphobacter fuscus]
MQTRNFLVLAALPALLAGTSALAQLNGTAVVRKTGANTVNWPTYNADLAGSRYLPLDQVNADNFKDLEIAWRFKTDMFGSRPEYKLEGTPLAVDGIVYATAGTRRAVVALNAVTGELLWSFSLHEGKRSAESPRALSGRGLSYWSDGNKRRILYTTIGYRLVSLDADTGQPDPEFGENGIVDLKKNWDQEIKDLETGEAGVHSAPAISGNTIIIGAAFREGFTPVNHNNTKGYVRAFDVRTGKRLWTFHTIPKPGEFGYDTWLNNSADVTGNAGVWTQVSIDPDLNLAYLNVESPTSDFFGGQRPGPGLFGNSLVAVDLTTGQRKWHYQLIHHEIWDLDNSSAPLLMDVTVGGKPRKVVGVPSKQGFFYVFDRATGKPVWPINEVKVMQGNVPGEWYSPTQPIPTRPVAYARNGFSENDLIDFTPELRAKAREVVKRYQLGGVYTPPIVSTKDKLGVINNWAQGGTNWPGGSFDPETGVAYVYACGACISSTGLQPGPRGMTNLDFVVGVDGQPVSMIRGPGEGAGADSPAPPPAAGGGANIPRLAVDGLPLVKPPYGAINAIDVNKGEIKWQVAHGETPDFVRNNPALKGMTIPRTGQSTYQIGTLVTKTLVIAGENQVTTTPDRPRGAMLRAYDKKTGKEMGAVFMPGPQSGSPMTYSVNGKQYVVVATSGGTSSGEYVAYTLPNTK